MNIIRKQDLAAVVMPLVQVMERVDLSWRDRERVSAAINACNVQWEAMEKERQTLNPQGQQQGSAIQSYQAAANALNHPYEGLNKA